MLDAVRRETLSQVPVWLPAKVTAWYTPGVIDGFQMPARADVEVLLKHVRLVRVEGDAAEGETVQETPTGLECSGEYLGATGIPVCYPGPRNMRTRGPLEVGEQGVLLCSTRAIETWAAGYAAEEGGPVDPVLGLGFRPSAAIFIPGLEVGLTEGSAFPNVLTTGDPDGLGGLSYDGTGGWGLDGVTLDANMTGNITLDAALVKIGAAATSPIALMNQLKPIFATRAAAYASLPGLVYATDAIAIKAAEATFAAAFAALTGSIQGRA